MAALGEKVGVDHRVTDFIEENPMWLDKDPDMREVRIPALTNSGPSCLEESE